MTDRYQVYEAECQRIRAANAVLLEDFGAWLAAKNLSDSTIRQRLSQIDLYINHYLLYEDAAEARDGAYRVDMFLGYWLVRKVLGASENMIRSTAVSLKQFYAFMNERGLVSDEAVRCVRDSAGASAAEGLERLRRTG
jgi:hypothetical protein